MISMHAFRDELTKIAGFRGFRRGYQRAARFLKDNDQLLHSTEASARGGRVGLEGIMTDRYARSSARNSYGLDRHATFGPGLYTMRGRPDGAYASNPTAELIAFPSSQAYLRNNASAVDTSGRPLPPYHALTDAYHFKGNEKAIIDRSGRYRDALRSAKDGNRQAAQAEIEKLEDLEKNLRPQKNILGLTRKEWDAKQIDLRRNDPEVRRIRMEGRGKPARDTDELVDGRIRDLIDYPPGSGVRPIDSQAFYSAWRDSLAGGSIPANRDDLLRKIYNSQRKQRKQLRRQGLLPEAQNVVKSRAAQLRRQQEG